MNESREQRSGCFKVGCIGCLGLFGVVVGLMLILGAVQFFTQRGPATSEERRVEQALPATEESLAAEGVTGELGEDIPLDAEVAPRALPALGVGRLELDLSLGDFYIVPGDPGTPIEIDAEFDTSGFELEESYEESEDGSWTYRVEFDARGSFVGMLLRGGVEGDENRIEIRIPRDRPVDIVGTVGVGRGTLELGGLWLREVDLKLGTGEHEVSFREAGPAPMTRLYLEKGVGELRVDEIGNASPSEVEISQRIGELRVDLSGDWTTDSRVDVACRIGACLVELPYDVRVELADADVSIGERRIELPDEDDLRPDAPTLTLSVKSRIGEVRVD